MERLLIIDGSNLLFQMFFGMPARVQPSHVLVLCGAITL